MQFAAEFFRFVVGEAGAEIFLHFHTENTGFFGFFLLLLHFFLNAGFVDQVDHDDFVADFFYVAEFFRDGAGHDGVDFLDERGAIAFGHHKKSVENGRGAFVELRGIGEHDFACAAHIADGAADQRVVQPGVDVDGDQFAGLGFGAAAVGMVGEHVAMAGLNAVAALVAGDLAHQDSSEEKEKK